MTKKNLIIELTNSHHKFIDYIDSLIETEFEFSKNQKWTAGQEMDHIVKSTFPISQILNSKSLIESKFGLINRKPISYEELIEKYHKELKNGGKAIGQFIPDEICWIKKNKLKNQLINIVENITRCLDDYTETELTKLTLPHPLLGKLTIQEMMFFTIYHVEHHLENNLRNLENKPAANKV